MKISPYFPMFLILFLNFCSLIQTQQLYAAKATTNCSNKNNSVLGYTCNGLTNSCQSFLVFRSQPPYTTISSISTLLNSNPAQLSQLNSVPETAQFDTNKEVIVPINCSCSGTYYQSNTTYVVKAGDSPFLIANNTFQGLSTCQAVQDQNPRSTVDIFPGDRLKIPIRCACPTKNQTDSGVKYLLSYVITWGDSVSTVAAQFGSQTGITLEANEINEESTIFPFTTLLIPQENPPSSNQTVEPPLPPPSPPPPPPPPPPSSGGGSKTWIYILVGMLGGIALTSAIGSVIFFVFSRRVRRGSDPIIVSESSFEAKEKPMNKKLNEESSLDFFADMSGITTSLKVYTLKDLEDATDNFSPSSLIEGSVFRGLINGDYAAIKKVNGDVLKEIDLLNKVNHFNLIRLSGVCFSDGQWYLVYEYAENGALSNWIYSDKNDLKCLSWAQRMQIAFDVATGLNYLHSFASPPHVHKDIKSSNVLLDSDFRAKISNLAMARSAEGEGEFALTRHIVGTKGYMAPEYLEHGLISTKLDVYAFGVLVLEIVTGKEVAGFYAEENLNLLDLVSNVKEENVGKIVDSSLEGSYSLELAVFVMRLIDSCLSKSPGDRPSMDEIAQSLARITTLALNWDSSEYSASRSFSRSL